MQRTKKKKAIDVPAILKNFSAQAQERYDSCIDEIQSQDEDTRDAIFRIAAQVEHVTPKRILCGRGSTAVWADLPPEAVRHNSVYAAMEIVKDLGHWDIKVEGFHFAKKACSVCGKGLK